MSDQLIPDVRELKRQGDLNQLQDYFNEPSRHSWTISDIEQIQELYAIAVSQDAENPVEWAVNFDRSHPYSFAIGTEKTRLGKILYAAKLYLENKIADKERRKGFRGTKREF